MLFIPDTLKNSSFPANLKVILEKDSLQKYLAWTSDITPEQAFSFAENLFALAENKQSKLLLECLELYYSSLYTRFTEQEFKILIEQIQTVIRKNINPRISCIFDTVKKTVLIKEYQSKQNQNNRLMPQKQGANKNVLYTCITGNYDGLIEQNYYAPDWDYICFTDQDTLLEQKYFGQWQIKPLAYTTDNSQLTGRWHKIHPHILLPNYEKCLYIDGNINVLSPYLFELASQKQDTIFGQFIHPVRDCIYEEILACLAGKKENKAKLEKIKNFLLQNHFPSHFGLSETGILFRQHKNPLCIKIMDEWWFMLENYSVRDQISLMYILWKNNLQPEWLCPYAYRQLKHDFSVIRHKKTLIIP